MAVACEALAQHNQAAHHLDLAIACLPATHRARRKLLLASGLAHERAGQADSALERYGTALHHSHRFAFDRAIAIHLALGNTDQAESGLRDLLAIHPADQPARACLGHLLLARGEYLPAAWEYQQALCLEPDTWELPIDISRKLQGMQSSEHAISILEHLIASGPHFPDLRMRLGNLYSLRGDDRCALREYRRALALHPEYLDCHIAMARHELRMGRSDAAIDHFRSAIAINNQQVELYVGLALAQQNCGQPIQAAENFASAGRIANNSSILMVQLGMLEMDCDGPAKSLGQELSAEWVDELLAHDQWMLDRHPGWIDLRIEQGMLHRLMGRLDEAQSALEQAAADEPTSPEGQLQLGLVLLNRDELELAEVCLRRALQLDPHGTALHYRLGLIFCGQLEFDLSIEHLEQTRPEPSDIQRRIWHEIESLRMANAIDGAADACFAET